MQTEPSTIYKLVILFMLSKVDFPLTNSQLSEFFIEREYTDYFTLQQAINSLLDNSFIKAEVVRNTSQYTMTAEGKDVLNMFQYKISEGIKNDVMNLFEEKQYDLRDEVEIVAQYFPVASNEFMVDCIIKERGTVMLDLQINVATESQAIAVCDNWKSQSSNVYTYLTQNLILK